jgi:hypothetical protein
MRLQFAGSLLCLLGIAMPGFAQESEESADDDHRAEARSAEARRAAEAEEREDLEPGVPSTVLEEDVQRTTRGDRVMDEMDLGRSEITGNQELPKVLYIVPWQRSDPGELMGKPVNTLLDEVLAPIDRSEFIRQVDYYDDLHEQQEE